MLENVVLSYNKLKFLEVKRNAVYNFSLKCFRKKVKASADTFQASGSREDVVQSPVGPPAKMKDLVSNTYLLSL